MLWCSLLFNLLAHNFVALKMSQDSSINSFFLRIRPEINKRKSKLSSLLKDCLLNQLVTLDDQLFDELFKLFYEYVEAIGWFTIAALEYATELIGAKHGILVLPPVNYHPSNILHPFINELYKIISSNSNDSISLLESFVSKTAVQRAYFHTDTTHFSDQGMKHAYDRLSLLAKVLFKNNEQILDNVNRYRIAAARMDNQEVLRNPNEMQNRYLSDFFQNEEDWSSFKNRNYTTFLRDTRPTAVISNKKNLKKQTHDKILTLHADSLFSFLFNGNSEMRKKLLNCRGLFSVPVNFSISPGSTVFELYLNFSKSADFRKKLSHSSIFAIIAMGTNEVSKGYDLVYFFLCSRELIPSSKCILYQKFKKRKDAKGRGKTQNYPNNARITHNLPKILQHFRKLKLYSFTNRL